MADKDNDKELKKIRKKAEDGKTLSEKEKLILEGAVSTAQKVKDAGDLISAAAKRGPLLTGGGFFTGSDVEASAGRETQGKKEGQRIDSDNGDDNNERAKGQGKGEEGQGKRKGKGKQGKGKKSDVATPLSTSSHRAEQALDTYLRSDDQVKARDEAGKARMAAEKEAGQKRFLQKSKGALANVRARQAAEARQESDLRRADEAYSQSGLLARRIRDKDGKVVGFSTTQEGRDAMRRLRKAELGSPGKTLEEVGQGDIKVPGGKGGVYDIPPGAPKGTPGESNIREWGSYLKHGSDDPKHGKMRNLASARFRQGMDDVRRIFSAPQKVEGRIPGAKWDPTKGGADYSGTDLSKEDANEAERIYQGVGRPVNTQLPASKLSAAGAASRGRPFGAKGMHRDLDAQELLLKRRRLDKLKKDLRDLGEDPDKRLEDAQRLRMI